MKPTATNVVNAYWSDMFGVSAAELRPAHGCAFAHAGFGGYDGVYAMMFDDAAPIVSVPPDMLPHALNIANKWEPGSIRDTSQLIALLGDRAGLVVGPAALLYADASTFRAFGSTHASQHVIRQLDVDSPTDRASVRTFRDECSDEEWETGGSNLDADVMFGGFVDELLTAIAGYEVWSDCIAHLAVVTHPQWRGRSLGKQAVTAAAERALADHLLLQYRTLESNSASLALGRALGFAPFATSVAVRASA